MFIRPGPPIAQTAGTGRRSSTSTLSTENAPSRSRSASSFPSSRLAPARSGARPRRGRRPRPGRVLAYGTECGLRLLPEGSDVEGEDLVEAAIAEVGVLQRDGLEHSPARVDVLAVPPRGHLDHLGRAVDRGDRSRCQPLADQGDRDAVAAADLEQAVGRADLQGIDRPDEPLRCLAAMPEQ